MKLKKFFFTIAVSVLLVSAILVTLFVPRTPTKLSDMNATEALAWAKREGIYISKLNTETWNEKELGLDILNVIVEAETNPELPAVRLYIMNDYGYLGLQVHRAVNRHYGNTIADGYYEHLDEKVAEIRQKDQETVKK